MLGTGEEAWLCGAVLFSEEKEGKGPPVAALFAGPNMSEERFVFARKHAGVEDLYWLRKVESLPPYPGSEPPHVIELRGEPGIDRPGEEHADMRRPAAQRRAPAVVGPRMPGGVVVFHG